MTKASGGCRERSVPVPGHLKTGDIVDYVCREIEWVKGELA